MHLVIFIVKSLTDFVFVARGRTSNLKSTDIEKIINKHIKNSGIDV